MSDKEPPVSKLFSTGQAMAESLLKPSKAGKAPKSPTNKTKGDDLSRNLLEDSFQKMYSRELDLDEDEVPIILHELNDSAIHFI